MVSSNLTTLIVLPVARPNPKSPNKDKEYRNSKDVFPSSWKKLSQGLISIDPYFWWGMTGGILKGRDIGVLFLSRTSLEAPCTLSNVLINKNKKNMGNPSTMYCWWWEWSLVCHSQFHVGRGRTWRSTKNAALNKSTWLVVMNTKQTFALCFDFDWTFFNGCFSNKWMCLPSFQKPPLRLCSSHQYQNFSPSTCWLSTGVPRCQYRSTNEPRRTWRSENHVYQMYIIWFYHKRDGFLPTTLTIRFRI